MTVPLSTCPPYLTWASHWLACWFSVNFPNSQSFLAYHSRNIKARKQLCCFILHLYLHQKWSTTILKEETPAGSSLNFFILLSLSSLYYPWQLELDARACLRRPLRYVSDVVKSPIDAASASHWLTRRQTLTAHSAVSRSHPHKTPELSAKHSTSSSSLRNPPLLSSLHTSLGTLASLYLSTSPRLRLILDKGNVILS